MISSRVLTLAHDPHFYVFFFFFFCWSRQDIFSHALFDSLFILVELVSARCWDISGKLMRVVSTTPTPAVAFVSASCRTLPRVLASWTVGCSDSWEHELWESGCRNSPQPRWKRKQNNEVTPWESVAELNSLEPFSTLLSPNCLLRVKFCRVTGGQTHNLLNRHLTLLKLGNSMSQICTRTKKHKAFQLKVQCVKFFAFSSLSVGVPSKMPVQDGS